MNHTHATNESLLDEVAYLRARVQALESLEAEREQRLLAEALRDSTAALTRSLDLDTVLDQILMYMARVTNYDTANIMLVEDGIARIVRQRGYEVHSNVEQLMSARLHVDDTPALLRMRATGKPILIADVRAYAGWVVPVDASGWIRAYASAPIVIDGELIGFMNMDSAVPGTFTDEHIVRLQAFADTAALAIRNARLFSELNETQGRFSQLANSIEHIFWLANPRTGEFNYLSPAFERIWGVPQEALLHHDPFVLLQWVHPEDRDHLESVMRQDTARLVKGQLNTMETRYRIIRPQGDTRWLWMRVFPVRNEQGKVYHLAGVTEDVTARIEAEEQTRTLTQQKEHEQLRYRSLFEQSNDAIYIIGTDGCYITSNQRGAEMLGYDHPDALGGITRAKHVVPSEYDHCQDQLQRLLAGETFAPYERTMQRLDGSIFPAEVNAELVRDTAGNPMYVQSIIRDITHRKRAESREIELAVERERVNVLSTFVRDISHDFKTPLSTVNTSLYLLRHTLHEPKQNKHLDTIEKQMQRLHKLITGLLTMTLLDSGVPIALSAVDVNRLIADLVPTLQTQAEAQHIAFSAHLRPNLPFVYGNQQELSKAIQQLVDNSLQFTPPAGQVTVYTRAVDDTIQIEVADTGIGMSEDDLPHIFKRFYRADKARSTDTGGVGLGLPIVKQIVAAHNGQIDVASVSDGGSRFTITLPAAAGTENAARVAS